MIVKAVRGFAAIGAIFYGLLAMTLVTMIQAYGQDSRSLNHGLDLESIPEVHWMRPTEVEWEQAAKVLSDSNLEPDDFMRAIAFHAIRLDIGHDLGFISVDLEIDRDHLRFPIAQRENRNAGQVYAVDLLRHLHFDVSLGRGSFFIRNVSGFLVQVKLPVLPDAVAVRDLILDLESETVTGHAEAIWSFIRLVARANLRLQRVESIDWYAPLLKNLPLILTSLQF